MRAIHPLVIIEKLFPAPSVAYEQLSINEFVPDYFIESKKRRQLLSVGSPAGNGPNPYRRIYQHHLGYMPFCGRRFASAGHVLRFRFCSD